jgi:hypothetical protein
MSEYVGLMVDRAARLADGWREGQVLDVPDEMIRLTMSVLAMVVFDADIEDQEARETGNALSTCLGMFGRLASPYALLLDQIPSPRNREFERVLRVFDGTVARLVQTRLAGGADGSDVLSQLMRARDPDTGEAMSDGQIRDEVLTLMVAGHETWTNSLIWTWFLLSENPEARELMEDELDEVLGDRPATAQDVRALRYTNAVYSESLRLFPPVWTGDRPQIPSMDPRSRGNQIVSCRRTSCSTTRCSERSRSGDRGCPRAPSPCRPSPTSRSAPAPVASTAPRDARRCALPGASRAVGLELVAGLPVEPAPRSFVPATG